jgi:hypothetical protein
MNDFTKLKVVDKKIVTDWDTLNPLLRVTIDFPFEPMQDQGVLLDDFYTKLGKELSEAIKNFKYETVE